MLAEYEPRQYVPLATALYLFELEPTGLNLQRKDLKEAANLQQVLVIDGIDQKLPLCAHPTNYLTGTLLLPLRQVKFYFLGSKPDQLVIALKSKQRALNLIPS